MTSATRPPVERACYWLTHRQRSPREPLRGKLQADVVIAGGGLTGLWTAIHIKELDPATEVVLLEAHFAGYGASGRNAGMLLATIDHSHLLAVAHFGREEASRLARLGRDNAHAMLRLLDERGIDADVETTGSLSMALSDEHLVDLRAELTCAEELGLDDMVLLDRDATRAEIHSERYHGSLFDPACAVLHPVKLVEGLAGEAERLGCKLFETTPVQQIEASGEGVRMSSAEGAVTARRGVLATNAYSHLLWPPLRHRFLPLYDYVLVSEPLDAAHLEHIGWRNRQGVSDARNFFNYYRLTTDDRVVFGTSEAVYYAGNGVGPEHDHSESHYRDLRASFERHFPALAALDFPYAWGGPIAATTRFTPMFGSVLGGRIHHALGYTGHGLGTTHLAGKILACSVLSRSSPLLDLAMVMRPPLPYPPEPIRSWAVGAVTRALRKSDEGARASMLLRLLDAMGIGLSS